MAASKTWEFFVWLHSYYGPTILLGLADVSPRGFGSDAKVTP